MHHLRLGDHERAARHVRRAQQFGSPVPIGSVLGHVGSVVQGQAAEYNRKQRSKAAKLAPVVIAPVLDDAEVARLAKEAKEADLSAAAAAAAAEAGKEEQERRDEEAARAEQAAREAEAAAAAAKLPGPVYVVKSQIHAGGRGAGRFMEDPNGKGGVRVVKSAADVHPCRGHDGPRSRGEAIDGGEKKGLGLCATELQEPRQG
jgi:hypothetical protein